MLLKKFMFAALAILTMVTALDAAFSYDQHVRLRRRPVAVQEPPPDPPPDPPPAPGDPINQDCSAAGGACSFNVASAGTYETLVSGLSPLTAQMVSSDKNCKFDSLVPGEPYHPTVDSGGEVAFTLTATSACTVIVGENVIPVAGGANLQAAINAAQPGDVLELAEGATFVGSHFLTPETGWVKIRGAGTGATLIANDSPGTIQTQADASYWYLQNLTLEQQIGTGDMVRLGTHDQLEADMPEYFVVDDVHFKGDAVNGTRGALKLHSRYTWVKNSEFTDLKYAGFDSNGIGGWNGWGPYWITDNDIQSCGYGIMFGGSDPSITGVVPTGVTVTRNYIHKPLEWETQGWTCKNLIEFKMGIDVTITYNTFDGNWASTASSTGYFAWFKSTNQTGLPPNGWQDCTWCEVRNLEFSHNLVLNVASGFNLHRGVEGPNVPMTDVRIKHNFIHINPDVFALSWTGDGRIAGTMAGIADLVFDHNTFVVSSTNFHDRAFGFDELGVTLARFVFTNNIWSDHSAGFRGPSRAEGIGDDNPCCTVGTLDEWTPGFTFLANLRDGSSGFYPAGNFTVSDLVTVAKLNMTTRLLDPDSPYKGTATDGTDPGWDGTGGRPQ